MQILILCNITHERLLFRQFSFAYFATLRICSMTISAGISLFVEYIVVFIRISHKCDNRGCYFCTCDFRCAGVVSIINLNNYENQESFFDIIGRARLFGVFRNSVYRLAIKKISS